MMQCDVIFNEREHIDNMFHYHVRLESYVDGDRKLVFVIRVSIMKYADHYPQRSGLHPVATFDIVLSRFTSESNAIRMAVEVANFMRSLRESSESKLILAVRNCLAIEINGILTNINDPTARLSAIQFTREVLDGYS